MSEERSSTARKEKKSEAGFKHTQVTQFGTIRLDEEVLAGIAACTVQSTEGVADMVGGMTDGITEMLGKKSVSKGIKIDAGNNQLVIDVNILIYYGNQIPVLARQIQQRVFDDVRNMMDLEVDRINVYVQGLVFECSQNPQQTAGTLQEE